MGKGIVKISPILILEGLKFPNNWEIEKLSYNKNEGDFQITATISGPEFPEVKKGEVPEDCIIEVKKEYLQFTIKQYIK